MSAWDWQDHAACRGMPLDWFFSPGTHAPDPRATAACVRCPVWQDCLRAGLGEHGLWGGMTEAERANWERRERRAKQRQREGAAA